MTRWGELDGRYEDIEELDSIFYEHYNGLRKSGRELDPGAPGHIPAGWRRLYMWMVTEPDSGIKAAVPAIDRQSAKAVAWPIIAKDLPRGVEVKQLSVERVDLPLEP